MSQSDYDRIGGGAALTAVVDEFYRRLLADERVAHYFEGVPLPVLKRHQALLLAKVLGGPDQYEGRALDAAHAGLDITDEDYDIVVAHLVATMVEAGVPDDILGRAGEVLVAVRPSIVAGAS
jgi:hemoglobin